MHRRDKCSINHIWEGGHMQIEIRELDKVETTCECNCGCGCNA